MYSEATFQAIESNPVNSTGRVSGEHSISQFSVVSWLHDLSKKSRYNLANFTSCYQNIVKLLTQSSIYVIQATET